MPPFLAIANATRSGTYIPPKKPYSFLVMLDDILQFATDMLVDNGRISFWMPTANDNDQEIAVPTHPSLVIVSMCVQPFNKCECRRLRVNIHLSDIARVPETHHLSSFAGQRGRRREARCVEAEAALWHNGGRAEPVPRELLQGFQKRRGGGMSGGRIEINEVTTYPFLRGETRPFVTASVYLSRPPAQNHPNQYMHARGRVSDPAHTMCGWRPSAPARHCLYLNSTDEKQPLSSTCLSSNCWNL